MLFVSCSAGRDEGKVCIKLPSRADLARAGTDGNIVNIFVTGDYEAKKTVPFDEDNDQTVTFDSIPAGASVRVACSWNMPGNSSINQGCIGVSDEIIIVGGTEQAVHVVLKDVCLANSVPDHFPWVTLYNPAYDSAETWIDIPGASYEFTFSRAGNTSTNTSDVAFYSLAPGATASMFDVTAKIFVGGTMVLRLYVHNDGYGG